MSTIDLVTREYNDRKIVYHFDVEQRSIPVRQFVDTANATLAILDNFNEELFDNKGKFELRVITPQPGGLIELFEVIVVFGGTIWAFLSTDIGKAYIKGLTGHEPAFWSERLGKKSRKLIPNKDKDGGPPPDVMQLMVSKPEIEGDPKESMLLEAAVLAELIVRFLETHADQLEKIGFTKRKFRKAYTAKNRVYQACVDNREVQGLGFDSSDSFQFKRADFPRYITQLPEEEKPDQEDPQEWMVETVDLLANSPNWTRDGRKWQGKTEKFKDIAFSIEDEGFWHHVQIKDIKQDFGDNMRVQWAYPAGGSKPSHVRVLKVLSFNGRKIADPLGESELAEILESASLKEADAPDLFDHLRGQRGEGDKTDKRGHE